MSRQDRDQVVIQDENTELVEKPQSTAVDSFDHIVVSLKEQTQYDGGVTAEIGKQTEQKG